MIHLVHRCWIAGLACTVAVLAAGASSGAAQTPVKFTLDWRFEGPAAPFTVALDNGYFKAEGLDVTIDTGNGSRESIPRVASGTYDIGTGDVNSLIRFRDENPSIDLKAVMMVYDRPPFAIVGRRSKGITPDPKSLVGKKLGAPAADGAWAQWPIFKSVNALDDSTMTFANVGFPVREPMLASGEVDAVFGFSFSVLMNLRSRGVPGDDIVLMLMSDHGVELYGNVLMVSPKFAADQPEAVKGFTRALTKGLFATVKDPATARVIAESNASRYGIGNLITRASADFNVPLVFAALIALAILGVIIYAATIELERRMTGWAHRSGMNQG